MPDSDVILSAVVPVYNEADGIAELHRRLADAVGGLGVPAEIVYVDDGSVDGSGDRLDALRAPGVAVRVLHLSRNFGHQAALTAGLAHARGAAVVVLDADLQDPPELIPDLVARWRDGYHIVSARRTRRAGDSRLKRLLAWLYYRLVRVAADVDLPPDVGDFCLMDREVVDHLNRMPERNRYTRGLRAWVGFRQTEVRFARAPRWAGDEKYTFRGSLRLGLDGVFSLSKAPLRMATWLGLAISLASFVLALWFVVQKLTVGFEVRGWASTAVLILFLGGVQLLTIGVIGEYLGRVYDEVKQRPPYVVGRVTESPPRERVPPGTSGAPSSSTTTAPQSPFAPRKT